jgi:hypothetical protein
MNLRELGDLNNERFLREAFDATPRKKLLQAARFRRNVYLVLFVCGFSCIFIAGFSGWILLSALSLNLTILSFLVMTKYATQMFFLKGIAAQQEST